MKIRKILVSALTCLSGLFVFPCYSSGQTTLPKDKQNGVILHAFCWSFNTIRENMKQIADAGYTMVQTSPANKCFVGEEGGMEIFGKGKWYYHYQPIEWTIGNYQLGTKEEFAAMTAEAKKYGITVLVDVLPNHTAFDRSAVTQNFIDAVGGKEELYHANGLNEIKDYNDRYQCTTGAMGGLPDVNTENPKFQYYFMCYINDLIANGAGGFRYDTAKHIGLPSDPKDEKSPRNNFWNIATGRESVNGLTLANKDNLFIYGEVLQDKNVKEKEYSQYIGLTASAYGGALREALTQHNFKKNDLKSWHHKANPKQLVTWVESHDTYCNAGESAEMNDALIRCGWTLLVARSAGVPLFLSRPDGSSPKIRWGNNRIGARGNDNFMHPEVVAANKFRQAMAGEGETLYYSADGKVMEVARGKKGAVLVNLGDATEITIRTSLPDGTYTDAVHQHRFSVSGGKLTGKMDKECSYILVCE